MEAISNNLLEDVESHKIILGRISFGKCSRKLCRHFIIAIGGQRQRKSTMELTKIKILFPQILPKAFKTIVKLAHRKFFIEISSRATFF